MHRIIIRPGAQTLTTDESDALRADAEAIGDVELARIIGLSRHALARCVARFSVHAGTAALCRHYLQAREMRAA